jgi:uncharacterized protein DUF1616
MRRANAELLAAAAFAVLGAIVVALIPGRPVRVLFALPLLLLLPGVALAAALFPRTRLDRARRLLLQLGLSLAVAILGALLLELTVGLRRSSWVVLLALVTCAAVAVSIRRGAGHAPGTFQVPHIRFAEAAMFCLAIALVTATLVFARTPLAAKHVQGYTALSMLPMHAGSRVVHVQISSSELRPLRYRLELYAGRRRLEVRRVALVPGQQWQTSLQLTPNESAGVKWIRARLYRADHRHAIYRSVWVRPSRS